MRKLIIMTATVAATMSTASLAQSGKTVTVDNQYVSGTRTVERGDGSVARDTDLTRKSDGATFSQSYDRTRTDSGYTASGSRTNFGGESFTYSGSGTKTDSGFVANQNWKDASGNTVFNRDATTSRTNGQVTRNVSSTRAEGFKPRAVRKPRGSNN